MKKNHLMSLGTPKLIKTIGSQMNFMDQTDPKLLDVSGLSYFSP
jgi:hypothetical protein